MIEKSLKNDRHHYERLNSLFQSFDNKLLVPSPELTGKQREKVFRNFPRETQLHFPIFLLPKNFLLQIPSLFHVDYIDSFREFSIEINAKMLRNFVWSYGTKESKISSQLNYELFQAKQRNNFNISNQVEVEDVKWKTLEAWIIWITWSKSGRSELFWRGELLQVYKSFKWFFLQQMHLNFSLLCFPNNNKNFFNCLICWAKQKYSAWKLFHSPNEKNITRNHKGNVWILFLSTAWKKKFKQQTNKFLDRTKSSTVFGGKLNFDRTRKHLLKFPQVASSTHETFSKLKTQKNSLL